MLTNVPPMRIEIVILQCSAVPAASEDTEIQMSRRFKMAVQFDGLLSQQVYLPFINRMAADDRICSAFITNCGWMLR